MSSQTTLEVKQKTRLGKSLPTVSGWIKGLLTCSWLKRAVICPDYSWLMGTSLLCVLYLLVVKGIVNGVTQRRDKIWLRYQQHALLDQKLCLGHVDRNTQRRW